MLIWAELACKQYINHRMAFNGLEKKPMLYYEVNKIIQINFCTIGHWLCFIHEIVDYMLGENKVLLAGLDLYSALPSNSVWSLVLTMAGRSSVGSEY
jgi:hypothetical protein